MPKGNKPAKAASTAVKKGKHTAKKAKIWTKTTFRRPKTTVEKRKPKNILRAVTKYNTFDKFAVIKHPLSSESAIKTIEDDNTLVFVVHIKANKAMIKQACQMVYNIKVKKVNTLITQKVIRKHMLHFLQIKTRSMLQIES